MVTGDTTHVDAVDRWGNLFAATPSGGWIRLVAGGRGARASRSARAARCSTSTSATQLAAPGKRPRTTLTPSLALRDGQPWLAFGTPGGDQQDQWTLQFLLNVVDFGMDLQEALDAPTVHSTTSPGSFYPHLARPAAARVEGRISATV